MERRRVIQEFSLEERLAKQAELARAEAHKLPPGKKRQALLEKARHADLAARMNDWVSSTGSRERDRDSFG
jgi:hypothetical protein